MNGLMKSINELKEWKDRWPKAGYIHSVFNSTQFHFHSVKWFIECIELNDTVHYVPHFTSFINHPISFRLRGAVWNGLIHWTRYIPFVSAYSPSLRALFPLTDPSMLAFSFHFMLIPLTAFIRITLHSVHSWYISPPSVRHLLSRQFYSIIIKIDLTKIDWRSIKYCYNNSFNAIHYISFKEMSDAWMKAVLGNAVMVAVRPCCCRSHRSLFALRGSLILPSSLHSMKWSETEWIEGTTALPFVN